MSSEAHKKAAMKYDQKNVTQFNLRLNKKTDDDIITKLNSVPNKQGYVKSCIRTDISKEKENK